MAIKNNKINYKDIKYTKLAYEQALINLGSTSTNPSVGCVVVKNDTIISSGRTSLHGRPHAESNALQKRVDFKDSDIYVSLEPCSHHGKTSPCTEKIIKKKIKRVIFSITDSDPRSKKKAEKILKNKKIYVKKNTLKKFGKDFYKSYFLQSTNQLPYVDAKLAISKDAFTINRKERWITNFNSRRLGNFIRSKYDCLLTTSKTVNMDNPLLDCRIEGLENKTPALFIVDRSFSIKKNLNIFKIKKRKIYILIMKNNKKKENYFKKKKIKIIRINQNKDDYTNLENMFYYIKNLGFNRILVESGVTFLTQILRFNLITNFYLFRSFKKLKSKGYNNSSFYLINKLKITKKNKIRVNLKEDSLYKVKL